MKGSGWKQDAMVDWFTFGVVKVWLRTRYEIHKVRTLAVNSKIVPKRVSSSGQTIEGVPCAGSQFAKVITPSQAPEVIPLLLHRQRRTMVSLQFSQKQVYFRNKIPLTSSLKQRTGNRRNC